VLAVEVVELVVESPTIYSFSDTGFKVLKRIYHPLD
jgi:hypothetical protein